MTPGLEITIGVLSLQGFGRLDQEAVRSGVEAELARLIEQHGLPDAATGLADRRSMDAGSFRWDPRASEGSLASSIAARLYEGLAR